MPLQLSVGHVQPLAQTPSYSWLLHAISIPLDCSAEVQIFAIYVCPMLCLISVRKFSLVMSPKQKRHCGFGSFCFPACRADWLGMLTAQLCGPSDASSTEIGEHPGSGAATQAKRLYCTTQHLLLVAGVHPSVLALRLHAPEMCIK